MAEPCLLDTGVLLLLARGGALGQQIAARYGLTAPGNRPLVSIVSHGELLALVRRRGWEQRRRSFVDDLLAKGVVTIEISRPVIDAYVEIDSVSSRAIGGAVTMGKNDLWIAATAFAAHALLITTDKDFDHLHPTHLRREYIDQNGAGSKPSS
jgi:tRNA(fMet)-specific endonuclease VapC